MPRIEEYQLHPTGSENDPEEERFKLSTLDYLSAMTYNNYALFFKLDDSEKAKVASVLKQGLERTLSQARHLAGTIEKDPDGLHSFVKRRTSTVKFVVQYLDDPNDTTTTFPSFADIEAAHFVASALGDIRLLSNPPMTYGEKPEADPDASPAVASYKANFIPGGLIFNMHSHHYANDVVGWNSFSKQLADNCYALVHPDTPFPSWDPKCLDRARFTAPPITDESARVKAPPQADRHPDHRLSQSLLFHLPKSRAAALKAAASPPEEEEGWISTYDAATALMWRVFSRVREPLYRPAPDSKPIWAEGVTFSKRLRNPALPPRMQGNLFLGILSAMSAVPALTTAEILGEAPLWKLARYARQMTDSVTEELLGTMLGMLAPVSNKKDLSVRVNSFPPMSFVITDWRDADVCRAADFGWGKPRTFRHLFDTVTEGIVIVYPPRSSSRSSGPAVGKDDDDDEGIEWQVAFEKELVDQLLADEEWNRYFEFRGVDAEEKEAASA